MIYIIEESINRLKLGVTVRSASSSLINVSNEMLGVESMRLSHIHQIYDEVFRFRCIIMCTQIMVKHSPFDFPQMPMMLPHIAPRTPSGTLNVDHYNFLYGWPGFTLFCKMICRLIRVCHFK